MLPSERKGCSTRPEIEPREARESLSFLLFFAAAVAAASAQSRKFGKIEVIRVLERTSSSELAPRRLPPRSLTHRQPRS